MDLIACIVCVFLGAAVYAGSFRYDIFTYDPVGGGGFPRILAVLIIVCGLLIGLQHFARQRALVKAGGAPQPLLQITGKVKELALMLVALILYALFMETIGYVVSTLLLVSGLLYIQHERGVKRLVGTPVAIVAGLYVIFVFVLQIRMPTGLLI